MSGYKDMLIDAENAVQELKEEKKDLESKIESMQEKIDELQVRLDTIDICIKKINKMDMPKMPENFYELLSEIERES